MVVRYHCTYRAAKITLHGRLAPWLALLLAYETPAIAAETTSYTYDAAGRLVQLDVSGTSENAGLGITYSFDKTDNRTELVVTGSKDRGQRVVVVPLNGFTIIPINPE